MVHITKAYSTFYTTCAQVSTEQLALAESIADVGDVHIEVTSLPAEPTNTSNNTSTTDLTQSEQPPTENE